MIDRSFSDYWTLSRTLAMASASQQTGMRGVFLVAAELSAHGLIVSPTSRGAAGADLLVTDHDCANAFSIQVKTNAKPASFWLVGEKAQHIVSPSHIYVLVNLHPKDGRHEFFVVPSAVVAEKITVSRRTNSTWYGFNKRDAEAYRDAWSIVGAKANSAT
jgi:hypothetical protein